MLAGLYEAAWARVHQSRLRFLLLDRHYFVGHGALIYPVDGKGQCSGQSGWLIARQFFRARRRTHISRDLERDGGGMYKRGSEWVMIHWYLCSLTLSYSANRGL